MKYEPPVVHGLKCFGTGLSFLVNMLVMTPLPAAGCESPVPFVSGGPFFTAADIARPSNRGCGMNELLATAGSDLTIGQIPNMRLHRPPA